MRCCNGVRHGWEPAYVKTIVEGKERPLEVLYFRIHIDQVHGRRGIPG